MCPLVGYQPLAVNQHGFLQAIVVSDCPSMCNSFFVCLKVPVASSG